MSDLEEKYKLILEADHAPADITVAKALLGKDHYYDTIAHGKKLGPVGKFLKGYIQARSPEERNFFSHHYDKSYVDKWRKKKTTEFGRDEFKQVLTPLLSSVIKPASLQLYLVALDDKAFLKGTQHIDYSGSKFYEFSMTIPVKIIETVQTDLHMIKDVVYNAFLTYIKNNKSFDRGASTINKLTIVRAPTMNGQGLEPAIFIAGTLVVTS